MIADAWAEMVLDLARDAQLVTPIPATNGSVGQKAAVTFGNLSDIGKALRTARKARREDMEQQAEAFGPPMFDF